MCIRDRSKSPPCSISLASRSAECSRRSDSRSYILTHNHLTPSLEYWSLMVHPEHALHCSHDLPHSTLSARTPADREGHSLHQYRLLSGPQQHCPLHSGHAHCARALTSPPVFPRLPGLSSVSPTGEGLQSRTRLPPQRCAGDSQSPSDSDTPNGRSPPGRSSSQSPPGRHPSPLSCESTPQLPPPCGPSWLP